MLGAVASLQIVVNLIDSMYALMAIPTMVSTFILAPRVVAAARIYFAGMNKDADQPTERSA
ncbi:MAG: hypothetical protein CMQ46_02080 [Gammaproteobacteria bacterium]|nr:hypothetical protein [Gammaproteobacteria bacterium]